MADTHETPVVHEEPDAWHSHTPDEGAPQEEHGARVDPAALSLTLLAIGFGFVFLLLITWGYYNSYYTRLQAEKTERVTNELRTEYLTTRAEAQTALTQPPAWIDRESGSVRLPLDRARELVVKEYETAPRASGPSAAADPGVGPSMDTTDSEDPRAG